MRVAVINGPNLNLLGVREPELYGRESLQDIERALHAVALESGDEVVCFQHNGEGQIIDTIHALRGTTDGAIVNAGAYSHSSLAIRDALTAIKIPFLELHISNVFAREVERHHSMLASSAVGVMCGFGTYGYELALRGLLRHLRSRV